MEMIFRVIEKGGDVRIDDASRESKSTVTKSQLDMFLSINQFPVLNCSSYGR